MGWVAGVGLAWALQAVPVELVVKQSDPVFEVRLPKGYRHATDGKLGGCYERSAGSADWERIRILIVPGAKPVEPGDAAPTFRDFARGDLPADTRPALLKDRWGGFGLDVLEVRFAWRSLDYYGRFVRVPLEKKALHVGVFGPRTLEREVIQDFRRAVDTLQGATNWKSPEELRKRLYGDVAVWAAAGLVVLHVLVWALVFRGRSMVGHGLRTGWHVAVAVVCFVPILLGHPWGLGLLVGTFFFLSMAGRRIKLAIDEGD
jgi:hypothetical protein